MNHSFRVEQDALGTVAVPAAALYVGQASRALGNFQISSLRIHPALLIGLAEIKHAAATANMTTGGLTKKHATGPIRQATAEIIAERTVGRAALYNEKLGFLGAAELAQRAIASGKSIQELTNNPAGE